ncbi:MAG TPA: hypothetical protein VH817_00685 [Thermoleophilaceae bacterium]
MNPHRDISDTSAAARIRLIADVRKRARRGVLLPSTALLVLGVVIAARGVVMEIWPHGGVPWPLWIALLVVLRVAVSWYAPRRQRRRGVVPSTRVRLVRAGAALAGIAIAIVVGANALIVGVGAMIAAGAFLAGASALGLAAVLTAVVSEGLLLDGAAAGIALIVFGCGVAAIGISARQS